MEQDLPCGKRAQQVGRLSVLCGLHRPCNAKGGGRRCSTCSPTNSRSSKGTAATQGWSCQACAGRRYRRGRRPNPKRSAGDPTTPKRVALSQCVELRLRLRGTVVELPRELRKGGRHLPAATDVNLCPGRNRSHIGIEHPSCTWVCGEEGKQKDEWHLETNEPESLQFEGCFELRDVAKTRRSPTKLGLYDLGQRFCVLPFSGATRARARKPNLLKAKGSATQTSGATTCMRARPSTAESLHCPFIACTSSGSTRRRAFPCCWKLRVGAASSINTTTQHLCR